jgi:hypothetical protein
LNKSKKQTMENLKKNLLRVSLLIFVIAMSCSTEKPVEDSDGLQFSPPRAGTVTTNPRLIKSSASASGKTSAVPVANQLFAFAGNNLYRIQSDDASSTLIGVDWGGTEAATIMGTNLFAVQGGHLWRCDLVNANCVDLGAAWGGTTQLTCDNSFVYGVQGGAIWKVATNGAWAQLGRANWSGTTGLAYSSSSIWGAGLFAQQSFGTMWFVNPSNGSRINTGSPAIYPYLIPNPPSSVNWSGGTSNSPGYFGAYQSGNVDPGKMVRHALNGTYYEVVGITDPFAPALGRDWLNSTDIAWTNFNNSKSIWILKNGQIYRLRNSPSATDLYRGNVTVVQPSPGVFNAVYEVVGGISGVYQIISNQTR